MATQFSEIGKNKALEKLFTNSGYFNENGIILKNEGASSAIVQKLFLENVDFDLTYNPMRHLGYKLALNLIGELYARMARPVSLQAVIGISNRFSFEDIQEIWEGVTAASKRHDIKHLSLDLNPSAAGLAISMSALGRIGEKAVSGKPVPVSGDLILLSGNVGAAYMGLNVLEREKAAFNKVAPEVEAPQPDLSKYSYILEQYLSPELNPGIMDRFDEAGKYPSMGYFVTRGLGDAVKQISAETGFGVKIYVDKIPIASKTFEMAEELNIDPITSAVNGGDDYRLVYVVSLADYELFRKDFQDFDIIGHLAQKDVGCVLVTPEGTEIDIKAQGYN